MQVRRVSQLGLGHVFLFLFVLCPVVSSTAIPPDPIQAGQRQASKRHKAQPSIACEGDPSPVSYFLSSSQRSRITTNQKLCTSRGNGGDFESNLGGKCDQETNTLYFDPSEADVGLLQFWALKVHCYNACSCLEEEGGEAGALVQRFKDFGMRKSQSEPYVRPSRHGSTGFQAKAYLDHCKTFNSRLSGCKSWPSISKISYGVCGRTQQFAQLGLGVPQQCFQGG
jgi:hypothetical protein